MLRNRGSLRRWFWGGMAVVMLMALLIFGLPIYQERKLRDDIDRFGGRTVLESQASSWLPAALPAAVHEMCRQTDRVDLSNCALPKDALNGLISRLRHFEGLRVLRLDGTHLSDEAMRHLAGLRWLVSLDLSGTQVGDAGIYYASNMERLEYLDLSGTQITDAGLRNLSALKQLESLVLDNTAVTDEGLMSLSGLARLTNLEVANTQVTEAGVAELAMKLPDLEVNDD